ncbi:MAG: 16S rRNA (adenine(1518)-N(6)/adenine(1519)-N(6))-dimethyltransferase RsmA [bacterium]|nr:16S rRNA (adenine(1518)-N(6)/adenine(1519)-N(6))-dimethyltransferase RsmA [bacterium]
MIHFFTTDQLEKLCQKYGMRPSKEYGQNYLLHPEPIEEMVGAANVKKTDTIVEVGPGFGILTFSLAEAAKKVISFEIEKKLEKYWEEKTKETPNIEMVWGNILYNTGALDKLKKYKVVANIPYQITSPLIRLFLEKVKNKPSEMVLLVQKEVAERICAKPGDTSVLSLAVQYYGEPQIIANVPRLFFWPAPAVDSAIIRIANIKKTVDAKLDEEFFKLVRAGFTNRRKLLIKNLQSLSGKGSKEVWGKAWADLGWDRNRRAQELSIEDWKKLLLIHLSVKR